MKTSVRIAVLQVELCNVGPPKRDAGVVPLGPSVSELKESLNLQIGGFCC
jgi:hypothetical protein